MKTTLLLTLALLSPLAQAASMHTPNQSGGVIVITDRPCPDQVNGAGLKEAYTTNPDGRRVEGCWAIFDNLIQIGWGQGRRSSLSPDIFIVDEEPVPAPRPQKNKLSL